ncbi:MAG: Fe(3+) ABC transporter substrate-binding protein [Halobacteriovoraceae bacterium]|nr:Fe(3+) ABC transporter substrate-binding protein [Halobacteriovoraceae bacterium]
MKILILISAIFSVNTINASETLTIYSSRTESLIRPILDQYTKKTGIKFRVKTGKDGALIQTLIAEKESSPADILMTVDAGNLWFAKKSNLFTSVNSNILKGQIPSHLRDKENHWFGLSLRARTIVYHKDRVDPKNIISYENLSNPIFKEKLCLRTSKKVYNQSLVSMLISELGINETKKVLKGWINNTLKIFSSDTKLIEAIEKGQCDIGIVNTYYLGRLQKKVKNYPVKIYWPNQKSYGVHVNVSGAGVTKYSKNKKEAIKFLEWLSGEEAQSSFASTNLEFPVLEKSKVEPIVKSWGDFKSNSSFHLSKAGELQTQSIKLMQEVGYK